MIMENMQSDVEFLKAKYSIARNKFRPSTIRTLLIAEAPPCSLDRYFYFEDVKRQDSLFLEVMGVLYNAEKEAYLKSGRDPSLKQSLLQRFQEDGFWLLDLAEVPPEITGSTYEDELPSLLNRVGKVIDKKATVILIKASVYDICYGPLVARGYHVANERIPFPGSGQQARFREKFERIINQ
jgi:hypothetical protein